MEHNKHEGIKKKKKQRRVRTALHVLALFVVLGVFLAVFRVVAASRGPAIIYLKVTDTSILQGEEIPSFSVETSIQGKEERVLDKKSKMTVKDLAAKLILPSSFVTQCDADVNTEGVYPVTITLNDKIQNDLTEKWSKKVIVKLTDGKLEVKNPVGEWEGSRFRRYDDTYVTEDFVVSKGETYYFDADGNKVIGWQQIGGANYYFDPAGKMVRSTWQDCGDDRRYIGENGTAVTGWLDQDGKRYYFDSNGNMVTGTMELGFAVYKFAEDGSLKSEKLKEIDPSKPMVALTFDDGPGKRTGELLDVLEEYNAHATFFMLGQKVNAYSDVVKKMKDIGCELGNHSYDHANLSKADANKIIEEISKTNTCISEAAGSGASVMRPPYGAISDTLKQNAGMPMILWNIDTLDWKTRNAQMTIDNVMNSVKDGDIILMHDIHTESIDAAIALIPKLQEAGYQLVTVSELAMAKGVQMQAGEKYTDF